MMLHVVSKHWRTLSSLGEGLGLTSWSSKLQCLHISNSKAYLSTYTKVRNTITWNTVCSNQRWYSMINSDEAEVIENDPPNETDQSGQPPSDSSFSSPYDFEEMLNSIRKKAMTIQEEVPETIHYDDDVNKVVTKVRRARRTNIDSVNIRELVEFIKVDNANDVCVIRIPPEKRYAEYLVICSGVNTKHIQKMAESLAYEYKEVEITGHGRVVVEGENSDDWIAIDLGKIVVHFMVPEAREKYQIEKLWTLGDFDDMTVEMKKYIDSQDL